METIQNTLVKIPVALIVPNPNNPRHVITPDMIDSLAASVKIAGLKNPIKVQSISDGKYQIVSGHIRLAAVQKLGWSEIPAQILTLTPEEALLEAILDNRGQDMTWIELYLSVETLQNAKRELSIRDIADILEMNKTTVGRAKSLLALLNPDSRQLIVQNLDKGKDSYQVSENAVFRLTDLEDALKVESALKVVIDLKLTEPQAKDLVDWIRAGNDPATFNFTLGKLPDGSKVPGREAIKGLRSFKDNPMDPNASFWQPLPEGVKVAMTKAGYKIQMAVPASMGVAAVYGALANMEHTKALAGDVENTQYKDALQKVCADGAAEWILERNQAAEKAEKVKGEKVEKTETPSTPPVAVAVSKSEPADSTHSMNPGQADSAQVGAVARDDEKETAPASANTGLLGQLHGAVKGYLQNLPGNLTDTLVKDGKQAVNYEIRKGMRNAIKDVFFKP